MSTMSKMAKRIEEAIEIAKEARRNGWNGAIDKAVTLIRQLADDADDRIDHGLTRTVLEHAAYKVSALKE